MTQDQTVPEIVVDAPDATACPCGCSCGPDCSCGCADAGVCTCGGDSAPADPSEVVGQVRNETVSSSDEKPSDEKASGGCQCGCKH